MDSPQFVPSSWSYGDGQLQIVGPIMASPEAANRMAQQQAKVFEEDKKEPINAPETESSPFAGIGLGLGILVGVAGLVGTVIYFLPKKQNKA